ncbi:hypothetical protein Poli38472_010209 [Pythium oligandrum]|uniref:Ankyrin repeat-containing domain n=1 Tax=Pythium oligandrum TaxID=41045 RepID=A0A8K1FCS7_PYTOL|nr:hypothetical protein Poli38472_010209 [Pythium oligandrum]|eukprot:TMW58650.1 hypothetical protein Poli38472_010209 [Pythium oligandrum]
MCFYESLNHATSYMEMAIRQGNVHAIKLTYQMHKQGFTREYPRFSFRKPMRIAAGYGQMEILKWLSEQDENEVWLQDPWLIDSAITSSKIDVARWAYQKYKGSHPVTVLTRSLEKIASSGALDLLKWTLEISPDVELTTKVMDNAAANGHLTIVKYLHEKGSDGCSTSAMDKAAANGHLDVVHFLLTHRHEGCTVNAMSPRPSKKLRSHDAADDATDASERPTRSGEATIAVLTDEALLQHVTEFQDGLPMFLHPAIRRSYLWMSSSMQKEFRRNGLERAGLAGAKSEFFFFAKQ